MLGLAGEAYRTALTQIAEGSDGCIRWTGSIDSEGYGRMSHRLAHRVIFCEVRGDLGDLHLDHICHDPNACPGGVSCPHRACVNPAHLAPTTHIDNVLRGCGPTAVNARKTACNKGHEFTPANTYITTTGGRRCRTCGAAASRAYKARRAEVSPC